MTDQNQTPNPSTPAPTSACTPKHCGGSHPRRRWMLAGIAVATGLIGFGIGKASSGPWGHHFGSRFGMNRTMDADMLIRKTDAGIGRILGRVDATSEQKSKVADITKAAIKDLSPLRDQHKAVRDKLAAALKAEKIDRAAIEQLRTEELSLAETLSKRAAQALADMAEVLTPIQRGKLVEQWQQRFGRG